jgi:ABC-2 type transport system permease protein
VSVPAPLARAVIAQAGMDARLTARRGENILALIGIPVAALLFIGGLGMPGPRDPGDVLAATLALAIVASGLVNLGIATAYERGYGVLKRLGGSPLGRAGLVTAKVFVVGVIALGQVAALLGLAVLVLGWRPGPEASIVGVAVTTLFGTATFATVGLMLAGTLRSESTLVLANAAFLVAVLIGGVLVPIDELPEPLQTVALILPTGALAAAFRGTLGDGGDVLRNLAIVAGWGVAALVATVRTFRWE